MLIRSYKHNLQHITTYLLSIVYACFPTADDESRWPFSPSENCHMLSTKTTYGTIMLLMRCHTIARVPAVSFKAEVCHNSMAKS